jgi:hypothetical protein
MRQRFVVKQSNVHGLAPAAKKVATSARGLLSPEVQEKKRLREQREEKWVWEGPLALSLR